MEYFSDTIVLLPVFEEIESQLGISRKSELYNLFLHSMIAKVNSVPPV